MATMDITASKLRTRESAELQSEIQTELVIARATIDEKDRSISALLNDQTQLKDKFEEEVSQTVIRLSHESAAEKTKWEEKLAALTEQLCESNKKNGLLISRLDAKVVPIDSKASAPSKKPTPKIKEEVKANDNE